MIFGKKVKLVAYEPGHWPYLSKWISDPAYKFYFRNIPMVMKVSELENFPQVMHMNVLVVLNEENNPIGIATWDNVRVLARSCDMGLLIDSDGQGKGYTKDAYMAFMNYLVNRLGFHKVIANCAFQEKATISKCEWGGMKPEGVMREHFYLDGKWHDEMRLSVLEHEFRERYNRYIQGEKSWAAEKVGAVKPRIVKN